MKATRIIAAALVLAMAICVLCACGNNLSGTYKTAELFGSYTSVSFSGSKLTISTFVAGNQVSSAKGTYEIKDGSITITLNEGESSDLSGTLSFAKNEDGTIKIGLLTFTKQ
ncbi:MAG: hypothetical protein IJN63_06595 [Clostridia bacterium]|nr:hypothetical protein [Clostridia bacterium]